ncbi:hypothetical protein [Rhizosaccharibacter radicis]|uniref:Uncharacterized protein n=1 Tax=Rhizosaccharibacter radicis TaxID=2782605 RepID=A0ABT1VZL9_9PROT|nr:hypothetical protein [Acetobacteraceae bacterium KSS12]
MPFDGTDFQLERRRDRPRTGGDAVFCALFLVIALCLMLMPISAAGLVDIVRYLEGS